MGGGSSVLEGAASPTWAVVLAGGEGTRLRSSTREVFGDERPKQYAPLMGAGSLLRQTLERTERLIPVERTIVVSQERHAHWLTGEFSAARAPKVLLQPENRDTAAGVLLPVYWAASQDPGAIVVVFPSDHFVLEGAAFLAHVAEVVTFVELNPDWIVLLGARATEPDPDYGWVEPGDAVGPCRHPAGRLKATDMEVVARQAIRVRVLANYPFLWCWDLEDATGRRVESGWEDHWEAFGSPEEARSAGLARLRARVRPGGAKAAAPFAKTHQEA